MQVHVKLGSGGAGVARCCIQRPHCIYLNPHKYSFITSTNNNSIVRSWLEMCSHLDFYFENFNIFILRRGIWVVCSELIEHEKCGV